MALQVYWVDEKQSIIQVDYVGRWTWQEVKEAYDRANLMLDRVNYKVTFIVNFLNSYWAPPGVHLNISKLYKHRHANTGKVVWVSCNAFIQHTLRSLISLNRDMRADYTLVCTLSDAYRILGQHASLSPS